MNVLLFQQIDAFIDLTGKTFDKHEASDLLGGFGEILILIQRLLYF